MVWPTVLDIEHEDPHHVPPQQHTAAHQKTFLDHACELSIYSEPALTRLTGIIATLGPASKEVSILEKMLESGVSIVRVLAADGQEECSELIQNARTAAENVSKRMGTMFPVGIVLGLVGPEIQLGYIEGPEGEWVELVRGEQIKLTNDKAYFYKGNASVVYVNYANIYKVVRPGNRIYLDQGFIALIVANVQGSVVTCVVDVGGRLGSNKVVNIPEVDIDLPVISDKDKDDILFGLHQEVDFIFLPHVKDATGVHEARDILGPQGDKIKVVPLVENEMALRNIDEIIKVSDGIIIGRGDLGIEIPIEKLFLMQKSIIARCLKKGKPVVCASHVLYTMTKKPRPTRAETTDVANAVLDGADCILFNSETASGLYPLETIDMVARICKEAESAIWHTALFKELVSLVVPPLETTHAIAIAAVETAAKCLAAAIIVSTVRGYTARSIARYKPNCPILAVTRDRHFARQIHLVRGVVPLVVNTDRLEDYAKELEADISFAISFGKWRNIIKSGDPIVLAYASKRGAGKTDTLRVMYVTNPVWEGEPCGCK